MRKWLSSSCSTGCNNIVNESLFRINMFTRKCDCPSLSNLQSQTVITTFLQKTLYSKSFCCRWKPQCLTVIQQDKNKLKRILMRVSLFRNHFSFIKLTVVFSLKQQCLVASDNHSTQCDLYWRANPPAASHSCCVFYSYLVSTRPHLC